VATSLKEGVLAKELLRGEVGVCGRAEVGVGVALRLNILDLWSLTLIPFSSLKPSSFCSFSRRLVGRGGGYRSALWCRGTN
jgi:hypothetical protein